MAGRFTRMRTGALLLVLSVITTTPSGCTDGPSQPAAAPTAPAYEPAPRDVCVRMRIDDFAVRYDLTIPPEQDPSGTYLEDPGSWDVNCIVSAKADDDRYLTAFGRFSPGGIVSITGFDDPQDAEWSYRNSSNSFDSRARDQPGAVTGPADGWWNEGQYAQNTQRLDPVRYGVDPDIEASRVDVDYAVRHHNIVIVATMEATVPTDDVNEIYSLLHDMVRFVIDDVASELTLSAGD